MKVHGTSCGKHTWCGIGMPGRNAGGFAAPEPELVDCKNCLRVPMAYRWCPACWPDDAQRRPRSAT